MSLALMLGRIYVPASIRKSQLRKLFVATAAAFGKPPPVRSLDESLRAYALFTRELAEDAIRQGEDEDAIRERLYRNAYQLGLELRRTLRVITPGELRTAIHLLYRALGIKAKIGADGMLTISACYFSSYYASRVCRLISALDAGVVAGLSGGGRLVFSQRMTEGHECCLARLELEKT